MEGSAIGTIGLALCMILCGVGSAFGLYKTGSAAAGVIAEDGKKFSKVLVLALLPATQGIYGFVLAVMKLGTVTAITTTSSPASTTWSSPSPKRTWSKRSAPSLRTSS